MYKKIIIFNIFFKLNFYILFKYIYIYFHISSFSIFSEIVFNSFILHIKKKKIHINKRKRKKYIYTA